MAIKPENTFRSGVHKFLPKELHHEKMNNPYSSGTADDWFSGTKADLWIEYKFLPRLPQRASVWLVNPNVAKPLLSKLQELWLHKRHVEGRTIAVVIGCPEGGIILRDLKWEDPITVETFKDNLVPRKAIALWIEEQTMR